jgi:hypothetical protein
MNNNFTLGPSCFLAFRENRRSRTLFGIKFVDFNAVFNDITPLYVGLVVS